MSIRQFPHGYLFQSQIVSSEPGEWLAGVLVSEVVAKLLMEEFRRLDLDPVLSEIADGVLVDEARHLGFNHIYLEERFGNLFREGEQAAAGYAEHLRSRLQAVLDKVPPLFDALENELVDLGIDRHRIFHDLGIEARERLDKSIRAGERLARARAESSDRSKPSLVGA
jgi:hypothetical protein